MICKLFEFDGDLILTEYKCSYWCTEARETGHLCVRRCLMFGVLGP